MKKPEATPARPLRVLLVEDSENDAMLLMRELRRGGYDPRFERVYTPEGMERALSGRRKAGARRSRWSSPTTTCRALGPRPRWRSCAISATTSPSSSSRARCRSFVSSLENLLDLNRRMARGSYEVELVVEDGFPSRVSGRTGQELTRIVQETLTNVRRHAGAGHVTVKLGIEGDIAFAEVADDGRGFATENPKIGIGRHSMHQRAVQMGGELEIESEPGEGTRVRLQVPISCLVQG